MSGTYTLVGHPDKQGTLRLDARARARSIWQHVQDGLVNLDGTFDMEDFADDVPVAGTIEIKPVTKKVLRYDFTFVGNDGQPYRFAGQKDVRWNDLKTTMTTLNGSILNAKGDEVAKAVLHFDLKADFVPFLVSWKPIAN